VEERTAIGLDRVLEALGAAGQRGPVPEDIGADGMLGSAILVNEANAPAGLEVSAAVLAALFEEGGEARLILTRRSSELRTHKGQVSFPGGRLDAGEGPTEAALREAYEEVGLDPARVTTVGWIHPVMTMVSAALIVPVVATLAERPHLVASPVEVERVFDVALAELADPGTFHEERWRIPGRTIPGSADDTFPVRFFEVSGEMIWGATARMLYELMSVVLTGRCGP
jgi:8-oxo-dGTP pyrophosphatase MutT (NUDIX family)